MTTINLTLTGTLTLEAPVAIALPATKGVRLAADDPTPVPTTVVYDPEAGYADTAYVPASSLRGRLRRAGHDALAHRLAAMGVAPLDLRSFYMLRIGGMKSKGKTAKALEVTREAQLRATNPFISVFGAADAGPVTFLAGRLAVSHALPAAPLSPDQCPVFNGVRTDDVLRDPAAAADQLPPDALDEWQKIFASAQETSATKARQRALKSAAGKAKGVGDAQALAEARAELADIETQLASSKGSILQPLAGYRALPQGAVLGVTLALRNATLAEVGVLLNALDAFAVDPYIGGHRHHGCGQVALTLTAYADALDARGAPSRRELGGMRVTVGQSEASGEGFVLLREQADAAWAAAIASGDFSYVAGDADGEGDDE